MAGFLINNIAMAYLLARYGFTTADVVPAHVNFVYVACLFIYMVS